MLESLLAKAEHALDLVLCGPDEKVLDLEGGARGLRSIQSILICEKMVLSAAICPGAMVSPAGPDEATAWQTG